MSEQKRVNYMVNPVGYGLLGWKLVNVSEHPAEVIAKFSYKDDAVVYARTYMWDLWHQNDERTELFICNRWGRVAEKNSYPRESDPPESKG